MYLVINKWVTAVKVSNFSSHYLCNCSTLDIGVLGYIGIVWPKEHSPEVSHIPPVTPCIICWRWCDLQDRVNFVTSTYGSNYRSQNVRGFLVCPGILLCHCCIYIHIWFICKCGNQMWGEEWLQKVSSECWNIQQQWQVVFMVRRHFYFWSRVQWCSQNAIHCLDKTKKCLLKIKIVLCTYESKTCKLTLKTLTL